MPSSTADHTGGQALYSDLAIKLVLTLRLVFHLGLRQAEGFTHSVLRLLGLELPVPDHTTSHGGDPVNLSRCAQAGQRMRAVIPSFDLT